MNYPVQYLVLQFSYREIDTRDKRTTIVGFYVMFWALTSPLLLPTKLEDRASVGPCRVLSFLCATSWRRHHMKVGVIPSRQRKL